MVVVTLLGCFAIMVLSLDEANGQGMDGRRGADIRCFTEEDKIEILKAHNDYRRASNSSNIRKMEWNDDLEALSQLFIDKCEFAHNIDGLLDNAGFRHIGENLYVSAGDYYNVTNAVNQWHSEIDNYDYDTADCSSVCGHYTQTVWHDSYALGCGLIWCADLKGAEGITSGVLIICNYGPSGNSPTSDPFEKGAACSNCPETANICSESLCSASNTPSSTSNKCPEPSSENTTTSASVESEKTTANNVVQGETTTSGTVQDSSTSNDVPNGDESNLTAEVLENVGTFLFISGSVVFVSSFLYIIRFSGTNPTKPNTSQPMSAIA